MRSMRFFVNSLSQNTVNGNFGPDNVVWAFGALLLNMLSRPQAQAQLALIPTTASTESDDYYHRLGLKRNATPDEIKVQFRKLALQLHPDKSTDPNATKMYQSVVEAYKVLIDVDKRRDYDNLVTKKSQKPLAIECWPQYRNEETFLYQIPVYDIENSDLLVLDGYAFSVIELQAYAKSCLDKLYFNPHLNKGIVATDVNNEFSDLAKNLLRQHAVLGQYAEALDKQLLEQNTGISPNTVDAMIIFLNKLHTGGVNNSADARASFLEYKFTLSESQQKTLDDFIIELPMRHGGYQRMRFAAAFLGGSEFIQCIITTQVFGWQFVVTLRPSAMALVPSSVQNQAIQSLRGEIRPPAVTPGLATTVDDLPEDMDGEENPILAELADTTGLGILLAFLLTSNSGLLAAVRRSAEGDTHNAEAAGDEAIILQGEHHIHFIIRPFQ